MKYRNFATVQYSLVATSAVFAVIAELKQVKAICAVTDTSTLAMRRRAARLLNNKQ